MEIIIKKFCSKQDEKRTYTGAVIDLGYKTKFVAVGTMECAELANMLPAELEKELERSGKIII